MRLSALDYLELFDKASHMHMLVYMRQDKLQRKGDILSFFLLLQHRWPPPSLVYCFPQSILGPEDSVQFLLLFLLSQLLILCCPSSFNSKESDCSDANLPHTPPQHKLERPSRSPRSCLHSLALDSALLLYSFTTPYIMSGPTF